MSSEAPTLWHTVSKRSVELAVNVTRSWNFIRRQTVVQRLRLSLVFYHHLDGDRVTCERFAYGIQCRIILTSQRDGTRLSRKKSKSIKIIHNHVCRRNGIFDGEMYFNAYYKQKSKRSNCGLSVVHSLGAAHVVLRTLTVAVGCASQKNQHHE